MFVRLTRAIDCGEVFVNADCIRFFGLPIDPSLAKGAGCRLWLTDGEWMDVVQTPAKIAKLVAAAGTRG